MERFNSSLKGYDIGEVNRFVDEMTSRYEALVEKLHTKDAEIKEQKKEIEQLKSNIADLKAKINSNSLGSLYNANEDITRIAKQEARSIIDDAKKNASRIVNEALLEADRIELKAETLKRNMIVFKRRMRTIVKSQLETIDDIEEVKLEE